MHITIIQWHIGSRAWGKSLVHVACYALFACLPTVLLGCVVLPSDEEAPFEKIELEALVASGMSREDVTAKLGRPDWWGKSSSIAVYSGHRVAAHIYAVSYSSASYSPIDDFQYMVLRFDNGRLIEAEVSAGNTGCVSFGVCVLNGWNFTEKGPEGLWRFYADKAVVATNRDLEHLDVSDQDDICDAYIVNRINPQRYSVGSHRNIVIDPKAYLKVQTTTGKVSLTGFSKITHAAGLGWDIDVRQERSFGADIPIVNKSFECVPGKNIYIGIERKGALSNEVHFVQHSSSEGSTLLQGMLRQIP